MTFNFVNGDSYLQKCKERNKKRVKDGKKRREGEVYSETLSKPGGNDGELVDEVDADDAVVGQKSLAECLSKAILHRAVAVYVWNSENQVCLQRRSLSDDWFPGYWTSSCTGHVRSGEDCFAAARRELAEELGLAIKSPRYVLKFVVPPIHYGKLIEYELMYLLEASCDSVRDVKPDPKEVSEVRFLPVSQLKIFFDKAEARSRKEFVRRHNLDEDLKLATPDAILSFRKYAKVKGLA